MIRLARLGALIALLALLTLAAGACGGATPGASIEPTATRRPTSTAAPSLTPTPTTWPTEWPTLAAVTLVPYPVENGSSQLYASISNDAWRLANYTPPLAYNPHDHFYFARPLIPTMLNWWLPTSRYADLQNETSEAGHAGIDFVVDVGTPVLAAAAGEVLWADVGLLNGYERLDDPYGLAIEIRHDFGYEGQRLFTVYGHLSELLVEAGDRVEAGDVIGLSGNTGFSTGPHLHFEVRLGESTIYHTVNPELWWVPPQGSGVLVGRLMYTYGNPLPGRLVEVTSLETGQRWDVYSYDTDVNVGPDLYYGENLVLGDLPAGRYEVAIPYLAAWRRVEIEIYPGAVTFFSFQGTEEYSFDLPRVAGPENLP